MGATSTEIYRKISDLQNGLIELRAMLAATEILDSDQPGEEHRPRTGWRWVRGEGGISGTFKRDPMGTDKLPRDYDLTQYRHPGQDSQSETERATLPTT